MEFQDKTLQCATCGREFLFSAREQEFYYEKGFVEPKHCRECRQQRKRRRESYARQTQAGGEAPVSRQMFSVICAECGKPTQVPFKPLTGKPILCKDCFIQRRGEVVGEQQVISDSSTPDIPIAVDINRDGDVSAMDESLVSESPDSSSNGTTNETANDMADDLTEEKKPDGDSQEEQPSEPEDDAEDSGKKDT